MTIKKRCLLWDWTNTQSVPSGTSHLSFTGPLHTISNWNTWSPPELAHFHVPYRPMIHDLAKLYGEDWARLEATSNGVIHYFNEPERAGISVDQAVDLWFKQVVGLRKKGNKLVSPSCASDPQGQQWIAEFMDKVAKDPPDFLGVHWYGTDHNEAVKFLEGMHANHPKQKIFVTEIASISRDYKDVLGFTVEMANWMDGTEWVEEYGFFGCMRKVADGFVSPQAQLMKSDGELTDLMYKLMNDQPMKA